MGEPDGARLLNLARQELLERLLPELTGEARYRARLIANAMKIAASELGHGGQANDESDKALRVYAKAAGLVLSGAATDGNRAVAEAIRAAIRAGKLDGDANLYRLLREETARRRSLLG